MAFCKYCGKSLAEGETCTCQASVNAAGQAGQTPISSGIEDSMIEPKAAGMENSYQQEGQSSDVSYQQSQTYGQPQMNQQYQQTFQGQQTYGQPQMNQQTFQGQQMYGQPQMNQGYYQQPNPQMMQMKNAAGGFFKKALDSIIHPITNVKNCVEEFSNFGLYSIIVNLAVTLIGLFLICMYVKGKLQAFEAVVPYAKIVLGSLIISAANYFGFAAMYYIMTNIAFKDTLPFKNCMNVVSSKAVWDIVVMVVSIFFLVLNAKAGLFLFLIGSVFTLLVMLYSYSETVHISSDRKLFAMFISELIVLLVLFVLSKFIFMDSINSIVDTLTSWL